MPKIHLTVKDLLTKEFKTKRHGYDPTDVDSFLDIIMRDYTTFNKYMKDHPQETDNGSLSALKGQNIQLQNIIQQKNQSIQQLQSEVSTLRQNNDKLQAINHNQPSAVSNNHISHASEGYKASTANATKASLNRAKQNPKIRKILFRLNRLEKAVYHK